MLNMKLINKGTAGEVQLIGRLDSAAATDAEKLLTDLVSRFDSLVLDMKQMSYISSAGIRVLKRVNMTMQHKGGTLAMKNVSDSVMEVFEITGFAGLLTFV